MDIPVDSACCLEEQKHFMANKPKALERWIVFFLFKIFHHQPSHFWRILFEHTYFATLSLFSQFAGHQHIRMYDLTSATTNPVTNYEGISKNVTAVGFAEHGQWMYTGSEDNTARIWDIRTKTFQCSRIFQVGASVNAVCLLPNQTEMIVGDQSGVIHVWDVRTDRNEQLIPETGASVQSVAVDRDARMMTAINNKGYCYVWNLTCVPGEPAKLKPKARIPAHAPSYGVHCTISPDT
ncbi:unnamed protein product, partial [Nesidiocoris tenuis]